MQSRAWVNVIKHVQTAYQWTGKGLHHLLWPGSCLNCLQPITETDYPLCRRCWDDLLLCTGGGYCPYCGGDASPYGLVEGRCGACLGQDFWFDGIARCGAYDKVLREMILCFKNGHTEFDRILGSLCINTLQGCSFPKEIDVFVPVPLHWSRRLARGYNQAAILARYLAGGRAKRIYTLRRIRRTRKQPAMRSWAARQKNVKNAFACQRSGEIHQATVCLVDDIKTSGATINECARMLKQAGASRVYALVLAVAGLGSY
jgi:ComF family protein